MNVIQLTRLRHGETFYINPDLLERVDTHVDTVIRLTTGAEYVVSESGDEIVRRIADFRARTIALAGIFQEAATAAADVDAKFPATHGAASNGNTNGPLGALSASLSDIPSGLQDHSPDTAPSESTVQNDVSTDTPTDSMDHRDGPVTSSPIHGTDPS